MAPRPEKVAKVEEITEKLQSAGTVVVAEYRNLDVPAQSQLRAAVSASGGEFKIYKNTLARRAADQAGVDFGDQLSGPTALAFAFPDGDRPADPVALTKALTDFAKDHQGLVIKGGVMDGEAIDAAQITALSQVPPREEMLAMFAGLLQAPMSKFAGLLQAMPRDFAGLVKALIDKGGAGVADEGAAEPAAEDAAEAPAEDAAESASAPETEASDDAPEPAADEAAAEPATAEAAAEQTDEAEAASDETDDKED